MFYLQNVRRHDKREYIGIYRQMLRVIDKGVTTAQMAGGQELCRERIREGDS